MTSNSVESKQVSFGVAVFILAVLTVVMSVGMAILKLGTITVFVLAVLTAAIAALLSGFSLTEIEGFFITGCNKATLVIAILMAVGCVVGAWIVSGIVPAIIYYGLKMLAPSSFLVLGFWICCIVSFFTGSSYAATGTLGVAFMGIGFGMGITPGLTAGMVLSGAIFGDKMSPFSDTTNLAPAVSGTDIYSHIRSMLYTTVPSLIIASILYAVMGGKHGGANVDLSKIEQVTQVLAGKFTITPILLIVPILTVALAIKKVPPLIALMVGAVAGVIMAFIFQGHFGVNMILDSLASGFKIDSGMAAVDRLLNRGGISSMMYTISLALLALGFGEIIQKIGVLTSILERLHGLFSTPGKLVLGALSSCLITNMLTASQYLAIIVPGELFEEAFKKAKVAPYVLSRTLEDGGTIFSFLVPWSMAAIYVSGVLDVKPLDYLPYAYLALLCPLLAAVYALTGFFIFQTDGKSGPWSPRESK